MALADAPLRGAAARLSVRRPTGAVLGLLIGALVAGLMLVPAVNSDAATNMKEDRSYASAQLLKLSNLPYGWQKSGQVWSGTSDDPNSSSMFTATQYPQLFTCLGMAPRLSVVAAEANSLNFNSSDQSTNVFHVADVYSNVSDAEADFLRFTTLSSRAAWSKRKDPRSSALRSPSGTPVSRSAPRPPR